MVLYRPNKKTRIVGDNKTHPIIILQVTVWVVQQMSHCEKGVIKDTRWIGPVLSTDQQHALQQRHKLSPVSLLCLHITGLKTQNQVHLKAANVKTVVKFKFDGHTGRLDPHVLCHQGS